MHYYLTHEILYLTHEKCRGRENKNNHKSRGAYAVLLFVVGACIILQRILGARFYNFIDNPDLYKII